MSKPMGPIPAGFAAEADGMLLIGGRRADALVAEAGDTPLFVYDLDLIDAKIARFRAAFPRYRSALCHKSKQLHPTAEARSQAGRRPGYRLGRRAGLRAGSGCGPRRDQLRRPRQARRRPQGRDRRRRHAQLRIRGRGRAGAGDGRAAPARGPGQSRFRDQGLGHADGRRRQAVRRRCRARARSRPPDPRLARRMARLSHLRRLAGARIRGAYRRAKRDDRARQRAFRQDRRDPAAGESRRRLRHPLFPRRAAARRRSGCRGAFANIRRPVRPSSRAPASPSSSAAGWSANAGSI